MQHYINFEYRKINKKTIFIVCSVKYRCVPVLLRTQYSEVSFIEKLPLENELSKNDQFTKDLKALK